MYQYKKKSLSVNFAVQNIFGLGTLLPAPSASLSFLATLLVGRDGDLKAGVARSQACRGFPQASPHELPLAALPLSWAAFKSQWLGSGLQECVPDLASSFAQLSGGAPILQASS